MNDTPLSKETYTGMVETVTTLAAAIYQHQENLRLESVLANNPMSGLELIGLKRAGRPFTMWGARFARGVKEVEALICRHDDTIMFAAKVYPFAKRRTEYMAMSIPEYVTWLTYDGRMSSLDAQDVVMTARLHLSKLLPEDHLLRDFTAMVVESHPRVKR